MEAFDFAAGGGVIGSGVFVFDPEAGESGFEAVASATSSGEAGCVDEGVVGEHRGGKAVVSGGVVEGVDNVSPDSGR